MSVLAEILDPTLTPASAAAVPGAAPADANGHGQGDGDGSGYTAEEDAAIQQRLADLGYL